MRKLIAPVLLGSALALSACATNPYGTGYGYNSAYGSPYYGGSAGIGAVLGSILGASGSAYGSGYGSSFQQAAVNACGSYAARYGQVGIRSVRQVSNSTLRVYGTVSNGYSGSNWDCDFRSDGRITDFDL